MNAPGPIARAVGQQGVRVATDWESDMRRRLSAQECENAALRSAVEELKRRLTQLEQLVTSTRGPR
jgi:hypothetical protein